MKESFDMDLIARFQRGDIKAFTHIHKLYYNRLYCTAITFVSNRAVAEDIASESLIKLYDGREDFDSIDRIQAFLYVVTANACRDYLRHMAVRSKSQDEISYLANDNAEEDISLAIVKAEALSHLKNEIEKLPGQAKKIFELIYYHGLSTGEIAEKLQINKQTVLNQKTRAIRLIRVSLLKKKLLPAAISLLGQIILLLY